MLFMRFSVAERNAATERSARAAARSAVVARGAQLAVNPGTSGIGGREYASAIAGM
jgi:hypothetical protein